MNKNPRALMTLIRNRLQNPNIQEVYEWFAQKGVQIKQEGETFFLKANKNADSEIAHVCNGLIFKHGQPLMFPGYVVKEMTLSEARENPFLIWDKNTTIFVQHIEGKKVYMYWDPFIEKWAFSDPNKIHSSYSNLIKRNLYGIMALDPAYTYSFILSESGENKGIWLNTMYHLKRFEEQPWEAAYKAAIKLKVNHPGIYKFEDFDSLENDDFPLEMRDKSRNKVLITEL